MNDITNLKILEGRSEKNQSLFELLENHNRIAIVKINAELEAEYVSPSMLKVLGYSPEYFIGNSVLSVVHEDDRPSIENDIMETIRNKIAIWENEYRVLTKNGTVLWVETRAHLFYNETGGFDGAVYVQSDISDRKLQEQQLKAALKEKEYLMKELNHRVKNNLAMVSSLINLKETEISVDLSDLKHRINVIILVHDKLHKQNEVNKIEAREYFQELLSSVFFSTSNRTVDICNTIGCVRIPTKTVIPLGMIVNEIATNAIKHGFTADEDACFSINDD